MTEEEKEAIESLKGKEISIEANWTPEQKETFEKAVGIKEFRENCIKVDILIKLINKLQKENEELKTINLMQKYRIEVIDERELLSKDKIRKFIKEELPDDEIMECCETYDSNGVYLRKKLEELLEDNK